MNAKKELLQHIGNKKVLCVELYKETYNHEAVQFEKKYFRLKKGFDTLDYIEFQEKIDFEYDAGYGGQILFGFIRYKDDSRSERGEYDGSERWEYKKRPEIPKRLK